MRIGFYHNDLPVSGEKPGGVAVVVHRLARELSAHGHELTVWTRSAAPEDANYRHVRLWPKLSTAGRLERMVVVPLLLNATRFDGIDVLHLHGDDWFYLHRDVPTVRTLYGSALYEARHATSTRRRAYQYAIMGLEQLSARLASATYGLGPGVPSMYPTRGTLDIGIDIPSVVDTERSARPSILFVGTWEGRKRGKLLHKAFVEQIRPAVPDAELWMVSDRADPAPGVRSLGSPDDAALLGLYRRAWVYCSPSSYEGFGIPYLEAMANGAAVVAVPNVGALHVLGDPPAGIVSEPHGLGAAVTALLTDDIRRSAIAQAGRDRCGAFSWDAVVAAHIEAYRSAQSLAQRHAGP